jgi:hypothetical protein
VEELEVEGTGFRSLAGPRAGWNGLWGSGAREELGPARAGGPSPDKVR